MWPLLLIGLIPLLVRDTKTKQVEKDGVVVKQTKEADGSKRNETNIPAYLLRDEPVPGLKKTVESGQEIYTKVDWVPPSSAKPYLKLIYETEDRFKIPHNLLARLLYQESRYREDIITGKTMSKAGAVGIAQIVPRWHPGVDPKDPKQAIPYAGGYLKTLYDKFGNWESALRAYNWGPTNLQNWQGNGADLSTLPGETFAYSNQILKDVVV